MNHGLEAKITQLCCSELKDDLQDFYDAIIVFMVYHSSLTVPEAKAVFWTVFGLVTTTALIAGFLYYMRLADSLPVAAQSDESQSTA